jgi:glucose/arabinose dehydrogenase
MAFHPRYAVNGKLFLTYNTLLEPGNDATLVDRLSEFTISEVTDGVATEFSERILISQPDQDLWHNAGMLLFGNDGYLYVGVGDEGGSGDPFDNGQRIDGDFFSGILRIDVDNNPENLLPNPHPAIIGEYRIPADNPFVGVTGFNSQPVNQDGIRTEFFVVGLRNPWRFGYDQQTDTFFINDVGQGRVEEVNIGVPGANYGWSRLEGNLPFKGDSVGLSSYLPPLHHYGRDEGNSVTGGVFYRGELYPELDGSYIYNDYGSGMFGVLRYHGSELKAQVEELLGDLGRPEGDS